MKIGVGFEKRDWGSGRATWRKVGKRTRKARGPTQHAIRIVSNKRAKRLVFSGDGLKCYLTP